MIWDHIFVPTFKCNLLTELLLVSVLNVQKKHILITFCAGLWAPPPTRSGARHYLRLLKAETMPICCCVSGAEQGPGASR